MKLPSLGVRQLRVLGLLCGVVCVILCLAVLVVQRLVTDRQTDRHGHRTVAHMASRGKNTVRFS